MKKVFGIITGIAGFVLLIAGIVGKVKEHMAISIIGGADGPTSVFIAGKVGDRFSIGFIVGGIALVVVAVLAIVKGRNK